MIRLAETCGYDFNKIQKHSQANGSIYVISYKAHNAILSYSPIFDELFDGIRMECQKEKYKVKITQFYEKTDIFVGGAESFLPECRLNCLKIANNKNYLKYWRNMI